MKKFILLLSISVLFMGRNSAQELTKMSQNSFTELNVGVAFLDDGWIPFPGASFLWGQTFINKNDVIFEYEVGLAFPTLVTAKLGIGKKFNNTKVIVGVRPWPFNIYGQSSFGERESGYWITSIEFNPTYSDSSSLSTKAILNFGYRWNLKSGEALFSWW